MGSKKSFSGLMILRSLVKVHVLYEASFLQCRGISLLLTCENDFQSHGCVVREGSSWIWFYTSEQQGKEIYEDINRVSSTKVVKGRGDNELCSWWWHSTEDKRSPSKDLGYAELCKPGLKCKAHLEETNPKTPILSWSCLLNSSRSPSLKILQNAQF